MSNYGKIAASYLPVLEAGHGESVTQYVDGVAQTPLTNVMVDLGDEAGVSTSGAGGGGHLSGDGLVNVDSHGKRIRRLGVIEIPATVNVNELTDRWKVRDEMWDTVRIRASDENRQTIEICQLGPSVTGRPRTIDRGGRY